MKRIIVTSIQGHFMLDKFLKITVLAIILCTPFWGKAQNVKVSGLDSIYKICDSITFVVEKIDDTCTIITNIGAEKFDGKKWWPFVDDINRVSDKLNVIIGYRLTTQAPGVSITWVPCKSKYFVRKKSDKKFLKGRFRFKFSGRCINDAPNTRIYTYSAPFYVVMK